jgi:hypothetical protein
MRKRSERKKAGDTLKPGASSTFSCATSGTPFSVTVAAWASDMMTGFVELVGFLRWMNGNRFLVSNLKVVEKEVLLHIRLYVARQTHDNFIAMTFDQRII